VSRRQWQAATRRRAAHERAGSGESLCPPRLWAALGGPGSSGKRERRNEEQEMDETLRAFCQTNGYRIAKRLPAGRVLALMPLVLGRWRLIVGQEDNAYEYEDGW
jgi:hypothetical protein